MEEQFRKRVMMPSDINEHLPTLRDYTLKCNSVVECGVRNIVSSFAFAMGLKGRPNKYVLVDPYKSNQIDAFLSMCEAEGINASFVNQSDLECPLVETDLLFIDTWHVYGHLKRELAYWHSSVKKYIIMHDTTVDELYGETIRVGWSADQQSKDTGIPVDEIRKGLGPAIVEFLRDHPEWKLEKRYINNNGLTILARI
jgi:cephalosporin hydroxylase